MGYTVRGDVDVRAVDQLVRCADEGNALAAAICADGHVGYSQPIGGVVAYRDQIRTACCGLGSHADTIRIKSTLTPIGVAMAGADVFDPFKD